MVNVAHRRQSTFQLKGAVLDHNPFMLGDSTPPAASLLGPGLSDISTVV